MSVTASSVPGRHRGAVISTRSKRQLAFVSLIVCAIGLAFAYLLARNPLQAGVPTHPLIVASLAGLLVLSHLIPRRLITMGGSVESITLDEVLFVPLLLAFSPGELPLIAIVASVAGSIAVRRPPIKAVFNCGQLVLSVCVGTLACQVISGPDVSSLTWRHLLGAMAGTVVITLVSRAAVTSVIAFETGSSYSSTVHIPKEQLFAWVGASFLGGSAAMLMFIEDWGFLLAMALIAFVQRAYSAQLRESTERLRAERLQRATSELRATHEWPAIESTLTKAASELVGARTAYLSVASAESLPASALVVETQAGLRLVADLRAGPGSWTARERETLAALAGVGEDALRAAELITELQTITDAQTEAVVAFDADGGVTFANPAAVRLLRAKSATDLLGLPINETCMMADEGEALDLLTMLKKGDVVQDSDATMYGHRGNRIEVAYSFSPLTTDDDPAGAVMVIRDVSERRAFQEALTYRALHDELTGLPNRRLFLDQLDEVLARSTRDGSHHAVIFVDLDRFKLVNDSFGHLVGDQLLIQISDRLKRLVNESDTMARLSGDEFVILLEHVDADRDSLDLTEQMLGQLRMPYLVDGHTVLLTVSIGVAVTAPGDTRDDVMLAADTAAYAAKSAGRNCIRFATQELVDASRVRLEMESQLRDALENEHLSLRFQPIVDTKTRELAGLEALVRWEQVGGVTVPPSEFIPLAEDTGLIVFLGRWVLEEACRVTHRWNVGHPGREPIIVSVNLSALQLAQPRLAQEVLEVLQRTSLPPQHLCLEITETAVLSDTEAHLQTLRELRDIGVSVAVDDFGTGYSSLAYLRSLPVDVVKLDAAFIAGLGQDMVDTQIVAAVLRLCKALGRRTVAEGVETELQWRTLTRMGCPSMQGYLIAPPMRADEFERYWDSLHESELRALEG
ncbi:MAG: putative bifunctional diguanylate cyclase/phosphodiesterase [Nocardioidaceae bacterium]